MTPQQMPPAISGLSDDLDIRIVLFQSLRFVTVALSELSPVLSRRMAFPTYTAAEIADGNHEVNTTNKQAGKAVWDTTNNRLLVASGSDQIDPWQVFEPSTSIVPD